LFIRAIALKKLLILLEDPADPEACYGLGIPFPW
jgi:hypothetical protein